MQLSCSNELGSGDILDSHFPWAHLWPSLCNWWPTMGDLAGFIDIDLITAWIGRAIIYALCIGLVQ